MVFRSSCCGRAERFQAASWADGTCRSEALVLFKKLANHQGEMDASYALVHGLMSKDAGAAMDVAAAAAGACHDSGDVEGEVGRCSNRQSFLVANAVPGGHAVVQSAGMFSLHAGHWILRLEPCFLFWGPS